MFLRIHLFLLFFILGNVENFVNCQIKYVSGPQEVSITAIEPLNQFSWYPTSSKDSSCDVKLKVLIENSNGENPPGSLITTSPINITNLNENQLILSTTIPFNVFQFSIDVHSSTGLTSFNIDLSCNKIDFNKTKPQIIGNVPGFNDFENFHSFLKIDGFEGVKPKTFLTDETVGIIESIENSDLYLIKWSPYYIPDHLKGEWSIEIFDSFGGGNYFKTNSFYNDVPAPPNHFQNVVYLPKEIGSIINEFGNGFGPLLIGNVLSNSNRPFFVISNGDLSYYGTPIRGKKQDMVFISSFIENKPFNGINSTEFTVNSPAGPYSSQIITDSLIIKKYLPTEIIGLGYGFVSDIVTFNVFNANYKLNEFNYSINENHLIKGFPFGFYSGYNSDFKIYVSGFVNIIQNNQTILRCKPITLPINFISTIPSLSTGDPTPPKLTNFTILQLSPLKYLLKLHITSINELFQINSFPNSDSIEKIGLESLVSGDLFEGDYEIILSTRSLHKIQLIDRIRNKVEYNNFDIISLNPISKFTSPFISYKFNLNDFNDISFSINDLNLLNNTGFNIMYIKSNTLKRDVPMSLMLLDPVSISIDENIRYPINYNDDIKSFECKFIIPSNNIFGEIPYVIFFSLTGKIYNSLLSSSAQLRVNETYLDNQGPLIGFILKNYTNDNISGPGFVGWTFRILDDYNGFQSGFIKVMGSNDNSIFNFNLTLNDLLYGDKWNGTYKIEIPVDEACISQEFVITHVTLLDSNKIPSIYNIYSENQKSISNPFINFYNEGINVTRLPITCSSIYPLVVSKPVIFGLKLSTQTIDVGKLIGRSVTITATFNLTDENNFNYNSNPIFYLTSPTLDLIECEASTYQIIVGGIRYICETEIPIGFGYPGPIFISIYGLLYKNGYFAGYPTSELLLVGNNKHYLNTTFSLNNPIITSHDDVFSYGGKIWLYGIGFNQNQTVYINYLNGGLNNDIFQAIDSTFSYSRAFTITIKETEYPFIIRIISYEGVRSNEYLINPILFISPPPVETQTPLPTNSPQLCKGNPECGGSKQGYCSSNGCICYSPWVGLSCQSKVVIVPPPILNENNPSINITKPLNSSHDDNLSFTALVSIVSLRELDFKNNVIKTFKFDKWIQTKLNDNQYQYIINLETSFNNNNTKLNCTITVITQWFNSTTNITFANQNLIMNPSSLKYNINITTYPFGNQLNTLQLIIQAKAISNEIDYNSCSSKDFGETVNDNSNYVQLKVNDNSLYGRFIKRAIVDGNLNSINNIILNGQSDDDDDDDDSTTYYSSESLIAISIPYYKNLIQLDPDFGILLDSESANSICKENSENKLSTGAIIGIVLGCVGCAILITISIFLAKKYKYHLRNIKPLKLKKMKN
ncbi:hypothetical protein ACTFIY_005382 [Dictyostelium cf. discoideum]